MVHTLARILVLLVLWSPLAVHALGLGEIDTHSALNQPLQSEIELFSLRPDEVDSIGVKLASNATFEQAGVERASMLSDLRFKVEQKPNGNYYIRVYTQESVKEPFLNFLIEVNWSAGHLVREYTVLLDPPALMSTGQPRIQAPLAKTAPAPVEPSAATSIAQPTPEAAQPSSDAAPAPSPASAETATAPAPRENDAALIRPNDTLLPVALRLRPDSAISPHQMMLALLKANPEAFARNNVNNLKAGHRLRVPEPDEITLISQEEALREIKQQNALWASAKEKLKPAAEAGTGESDSAGTARLKLVAANDTKTGDTKTSAAGGPAIGGAATPGTSAAIENLQKDLTLATEAVEARRQENEELRSRMAELEKQVESMQRLITLKDENLAALQNKLSAPAPSAAATTPAAPSAQAVTPETTPVAKPAGNFADLLSPETLQTLWNDIQTTLPSPATLQALWNDLQSNPMTQAIAGGAVLLLLALLWIINRRRQMNAATITEADIYSMMGPLSGAATEAVVDQAAMEMPEPAQAAQVAAKDPLAEVDVYLAYEQYPQAEVLLRQLIAKEPYRHELKLRLLELFYLTKNKNAFGTQAEDLHTALAGQPSPLWDKAVFMGRQLYPEHPLFAPPAVAPAAMAATAPAPEIDFTPEIPAVEEAPAPTTEHAPINFDFDISPPGQSEAAAAKSGSADIDLSLENLKQELDSLAETLATPEPEPAAREMSALDFSVDDLALEPPPAPPATEAKHEPAISFDFDLEQEAEALADTDMAPLEHEPEEDTAPFANGDEVSTKLDLARAYLDMGDEEGATSIIAEILEEGNDAQKNEARELMRQIRT
ncbi:MAG: FimV/HubP family polar landmark protein [Gammaproteobacteria bacterium]|nr:FimV/HubP family polar landmark protein [Gammaproteobacteria bacterium]